MEPRRGLTRRGVLSSLYLRYGTRLKRGPRPHHRNEDETPHRVQHSWPFRTLGLAAQRATAAADYARARSGTEAALPGMPSVRQGSRVDQVGRLIAEAL